MRLPAAILLVLLAVAVCSAATEQKSGAGSKQQAAPVGKSSGASSSTKLQASSAVVGKATGPKATAVSGPNKAAGSAATQQQQNAPSAATASSTAAGATGGKAQALKSCSGDIFRLGDKVVRSFADIGKFFSLYSLIPKIDTSEVVALDVIGAPCGAFPRNATFYLRAGTQDLRHFRNVFQHGLLKPINQLFAKAPPRRILHLGAHTGVGTAMSFALTYPQADIVAVEPDLQNFAMLRLNTAPFSKVHVEYGAAWDRSATVKLGLRDRGRSLWQRFVVDVMEMSTGKLGEIVPSMHVGDLLEKYKWASVDLLHADLEGAERIVIADPSAREWLRRVRCISLRSTSAEGAASVARMMGGLEVKFVRKATQHKGLVSVWCRADIANEYAL